MRHAPSVTLFVLALSCVIAAPLRAAPVRALEHPEFSRLLLPVPPAVEWNLLRDRRSARLVMRGPVPRLELAGVFDRMPRSRIRSVAASEATEGATLTLELGCDCELVVERLGETLLAVDVRSPVNAAVPAGSEQQVVAAPTAPPVPREIAAAAAAAPTPAAEAEVAFAAASQPGETEWATTEWATVVPERERPEGAKFLTVQPGLPDAADADEATLPPADDPVRLARDALVRQLERAAAEGLVEFAPDATEAARALTAVRSEPQPLDERLLKPALLPRLTPAPVDGDPRLLNPSAAAPIPELNVVDEEPAEPVFAESSAPPPDAGVQSMPEAADPGAAAESMLAHLIAREPVAAPRTSAKSRACLSDATLDVRRWPQADGDLAGALGEKRRALYTDSGDLAPDAVRDLARLYITVGFGREAALLLETTGLASGAEPLHDLSMLVEGRPAAVSGPILAAEGCTGRVQMWRAVAGAEPLDSDAPAWTTIREGLMELPPRLRRLVGQELARQALLGDRPSTARAVIDLLDRTPGAEPDIETRVRAALAVARGEAEYALTLIAPEIEGHASPDPEALLLHARATLAAGTAPDPAVMTMLDTAIPGYDAGAPVGRALQLVRARLEFASGHPAGALDMVQKVLAASGGTNPDAIETGREILAGLPADLRSGPVGAQLILAHGNLLDKGAESRALRLSYADALIQGGLPNAALKLLSTPRVLQDREMRLVAAQAQMMLGEDDEVFRLLDGLKGPAEARMRATIYRRAGDMAAAHAELATLEGADADRNATALLAREWDRLNAEVVAPPYAPLAAYAAAEADPGSGTGEGAAAEAAAATHLPTLDAAYAALAEARRLREAFGVAGPES